MYRYKIKNEISNCQELIKEINGLIGAVNGNTLEKIRNLISAYNVVAWQVERYHDLIHFLTEKVDKKTRQFVEKELNRIKNEVRKVFL